MTSPVGVPVSIDHCPFALPVPGVRDPSLNSRIRSPWGFLLHTTGGGVTDSARKHGKMPIMVAIETYIASQNGSNGYFWGGPSYVIDHDGVLYQLAPENIETMHAGSQNRPRYLDGSWKTACSPATVAHWTAKWWPRYSHPYALFPTHSPNLDYIGCEMIPCGDGFGSPMAPGLRFTRAQHETALALAIDIGKRRGWADGWRSSSKLLGHEDVDPLERSDAGGGWDPGYLRASPYFDFGFVRS
jgi:hypothetical protein